MTNPTCPECGHATVREIRPFTFTYKGLSATVDMPGWYCTGCNEGIHVGKDMDESDKVLHRMKAQIENLLFPEDIRRIRKKLHLTQTEAGDILGGGPNAFHKYENGSVLPSHAISNLLRILDAQPTSLEVLRQPAAAPPKTMSKRKRFDTSSNEPVAAAA